MSEEESTYSRTSHASQEYPLSTRRHQAQKASQDNTETRYIHIQDPENYNKGKPIDEAVNTAFDNAHVKDLTGISPELIAQITQNVIQQLKTTASTDLTQTPTTAVPSIYQPQQESPELTSQSGGSPPPRIFTPPSPQKHSESHDTQAERLSFEPSSPGRRFRSNSNVSMGEDGSQRPRGPIRQPTVEETTTLERIWGKLFDEEGKATPRLGQFLRGIATHLIEDTEPKESIVVTPLKMISFYESNRISRDIYPWNDIFDDAQSSISRMYRQLHIQHHLVQDEDNYNYRPDIPGLTAKGFEKWQTLMIQAHPEEEFQRLQIVALHMPINNPDDRKERFPKDIPRKLFPKKERLDIREQLIEAMEIHAQVEIPRPEDTLTPKMENPPQRRSSDEHSQESLHEETVPSERRSRRGGIERERKPYSRIPPESAIDDLTPTISTPIERERKPYSAAPGGGKVYEDDGAPLSHSVSQGAIPIPSSLNGSGLRRSTSNASRPINIPPPPPRGPSTHRMSASEYITPMNNFHQAPHLRDPMASRRRNHSPLGNDMRRSDTDVRLHSSSYDPPSYMSREGLPPPPGQYVPADSRYDDDRRYGREGDLRRENYTRGGSPNRRGYVSGAPPSDEEYYRRRGEQPPRNW